MESYSQRGHALARFVKLVWLRRVMDLTSVEISILNDVFSCYSSSRVLLSQLIVFQSLVEYRLRGKSIGFAGYQSLFNLTNEKTSMTRGIYATRFKYSIALQLKQC